MDENELFNRSIKTLTYELPILRKMLGLTQNDLAEILGLSRQTITNIENENQKMKRSTFMAIMFLFSLNQNTALYLKNIDIPYKNLRKWLNIKVNK